MPDETKYQEMPMDREAEQAVFSILLSAPDRFLEVSEILKAVDFWSITHQQIYQAMIELFAEGQDFDVVSIRTQLKKDQIDATPALIALAECYENQVVDTNLIKFAEQVKQKSLLRQIIRIITTYSLNARIENADPNFILAEVEKELLDVVDYTHKSKPTDAPGIIEEIKADIAKGLEVGWQGFETGFPKLDLMTGGFIPTQVWIVGAYTGVGKTFLILQLLLNVLRQGGKVVLFSTEMDRKLNMMRLIGNIAGVGTINMMKGNLLENEQIEIDKAQEELASFGDNLIIYDNVYTVAEIRLKCKKLQLMHGLNIVAVDFIQNLRGGESIYERMSEAAISLQQLAQELNVTMIIGSQVSQASSGWAKKESIEFKGAGEIAAVADVALWMSSIEGNKSKRQVHARKVRHGEPGIGYVYISFPSGNVIQIERDQSEPPPKPSPETYESDYDDGPKQVAFEEADVTNTTDD